MVFPDVLGLLLLSLSEGTGAGLAGAARVMEVTASAGERVFLEGPPEAPVLLLKGPFGITGKASVEPAPDDTGFFTVPHWLPPGSYEIGLPDPAGGKTVPRGWLRVPPSLRPRPADRVKVLQRAENRRFVDLGQETTLETGSRILLGVDTGKPVWSVGIAATVLYGGRLRHNDPVLAVTIGPASGEVQRHTLRLQEEIADVHADKPGSGLGRGRAEMYHSWKHESGDFFSHTYWTEVSCPEAVTVRSVSLENAAPRRCYVRIESVVLFLEAR